MSGKIIGVSLVSFTILFAGVLYYFQVFAYYEKANPVSFLTVGDRQIRVENYKGIDSKTSGLKLRGCFETNPRDLYGLPTPKHATPLGAPFWFGCFDSGKIQKAIDKNMMKVYLAAENEIEGIDRIIAVFESGRAFQWRQLNSKFQD